MSRLFLLDSKPTRDVATRWPGQRVTAIAQLERGNDVVVHQSQPELAR